MGGGVTRASSVVRVGALKAEEDGQGTLILDTNGSYLGAVGSATKAPGALVLNHNTGNTDIDESYIKSTSIGAGAQLSAGTNPVSLGALTFGTEYDGTNWQFGTLDAQYADAALSSFNVDFGDTVAPNVLDLWDARGGTNTAVLVGNDFIQFVSLSVGDVAVDFNGTTYQASGLDYKEASNLPMTDNLALWKSMLAQSTGSSVTASLLMALDSDGFLREVASSGVNMEVFGGVAQGLLSVINDTTADPVLRSFISSLTNSQAGIAVQQMADVSVNNGVVNGISMANAAVTRAIADNAGGGAGGGFGLASSGVMSGLNAGDVDRRSTAWVQALGSWNGQDRRNGVDGYDANTYGAALGADTLVWDSTRLGLALHYAYTDVKGQGVYSNNTSKINTYGLSLYGKQALTEALFLDGRLGYTYSGVSSDRHVTGLGGKASGSYGVNQFDIAAKLGYDARVMSNALVTPHVSLAYMNLSEGGYTESGSAARLKVGSRTSDALLIGAGVRGAMEFSATNTVKIVPEVRLGATYDAMASSVDTTAQFVGGGAAFITRNLKPDPWTFNLGAGVKVAGSGDFSVSANYDAALREGFMGHTASLRGKITF